MLRLRHCASSAVAAWPHVQQPFPRVFVFSSPTIPRSELEDFFSLNESPCQEIATQRPYTWGTSVATLDGRIAFEREGHSDSKEIAMAHHESTSEGCISQGAVADWRCLCYSWATADAVLGSAGILRSEPHVVWDPQYPDLRAIRTDAAHNVNHLPLAVVVTRKGQLPVNHPIISRADIPCVVYTTAHGAETIGAAAAEANLDLARTCGTTVTTIDDTVDFWHYMMQDLYCKHQVKRLNVSAGGQVMYQLARARLLDEYRLTFAAQFTGDFGLDGVTRPGLFSPTGGDIFTQKDNPRLRMVGLGLLGAYHLFIRGIFEYRN